MLRICYISEARANVTEGAIANILKASRDRNAADGITGLLLHDGGRFLQVLEGPSAAVAACYGRIARDDRHHRIRLLVQEEIEARQFGDWAMVYRLMADRDGTDFLDVVRRDVAGVDDLYLRILFTGFVAHRALEHA